MAYKAKSDGLRLLRCINDTQARGREEAKVDPPRAAQEIGLEVGSERYHDALAYLAEEEALVGDEHTEMHAEEVEGPQPHAICSQECWIGATRTNEKYTPSTSSGE